MAYRRCCKGAALLISMIVLAILSAWAVSIYSMSGANLQLAENQRKVDHARASAESGLGVLRFWLGRIYMPGSVAANDRFSEVWNFLHSDLAENGISNITTTYAGSTITIDDVTLDSSTGRSFSSQIQETNDVDILQMDVTGSAGAVKRTIRVSYNFGTRAHTVFDYGVATRGPLNLEGNISMGGQNVELDAGVYIESPSDPNALSIIGNSSVAGDVYITNPDGTVTLQGGQASIGGETGQDAIDNHVTFGAEPTEFPVPDPNYFEHYVENVYDPNTVLPEYENVRIPAGTNPTFGNVTFRGVVFIEAPNIVHFEGNTEITGIVVGNGDLSDNSGTNQIWFTGTVSSHPVTDLPDELQFEQLRNETGTFLMAAGFKAVFWGDFETLNGAIAANGITFGGNAGGIIDGSVINYSDQPMTISGESDLFLHRSGTDKMPAGFGPEVILYYDASSYREIVP